MRKILRRNLEVTEARKLKYGIKDDTILKTIFKKDETSTQLNLFVYFNGLGYSKDVMKYLKSKLMRGSGGYNIPYEIKRVIELGFVNTWNSDIDSYETIGKEKLFKISFKLNSLNELDYLRDHSFEGDLERIKEEYQNIKEFEKPINIKDEWEVFKR